MNSSHVLRHGAGALAILAAAAAVVLSITGIGSAPQGPQGPRSVVQQPAEAPRQIGDMPLPLPESRTVVLQTTPQELLASVVAARGRRDLAALARCSSTSIDRVALDQFDAARAERDFFDGEQLWRRLEAAGKDVRIEQNERRAKAGDPFDASGVVSFASGSQAIAELQIEIVRNRGAWYVKVSP